jgi:uncharacterized membrane protein YbhN (UPF0104 family)
MKKKQYWKLFFIIFLLISSYVAFGDSIIPIYKELKRVSFKIIIMISLLSCAYQIMEGLNIYHFAKKYQSDFKRRQGITAAFYSSFYRIATFGTGSGVASMYYMSSKNIPIAKGMAMTTILYVMHKLTIALYCCICLSVKWKFMGQIYESYVGYFILGCVLTVLISTVLILICISKKFHELLFSIYNRIDKKGKYGEKAKSYQMDFEILRAETKYLLKRKKDIMIIIVRNVMKLSFWYITPYILLKGRVKVSPINCCAVTSLMTAIAGVFPSPAGIGSTEVLYTLLFGKLAGTLQAASTMLLYRFATFIVPFLIGAVIATFYKKRQNV